MKMVMEKLNREREELMKKHEEEKERISNALKTLLVLHLTTLKINLKSISVYSCSSILYFNALKINLIISGI